MQEFKTYTSLTDAITTEGITAILTKYEIPYKVEDTSKNFDASFSLNTAGKSFIIYLQQPDFEKANAVIETDLTLDKSGIPQDHFLYSFSEDELIDLLKNPEEWHPLDVKLAHEILIDRGVRIPSDAIEKSKKEKALENSKPEKSDATTLWIGYLFSFMGGLLGLAIALFLIFSKKTLPDGQKTYTYIPSDRKHGYNMLSLSLFKVVVLLIMYLNQ
ncbi:MAG: hypothetical protein RL427_301 [Bacteroidota bacterium]